MKNIFNAGFIILIFVVLGCNCQKFKELAEQGKTTPTATPYVSNTSSSPSSTSSPKSSSNLDLTMDKYDSIKNGMSYREVVNIIGGEGTQQSSSGEGKYKVETYKWDGGEYKYISLVMMGDKVYSKVQVGLK